MRDIFEDIFVNQPLDPMESARRSMRSNLRARFYKEASAGHGPDAFAVLLDGRPVRTPARNPLAAPARAIAEAIAAEWTAQVKVVDPAAMPLTRLANSIADGVVPVPGPVAAEIRKFLGTDLVFYRAAEPEGLVAEQHKYWDPVLDWARDTLRARFVVAQGVIHVEQPPEAVAAAAAAIPNGAGMIEAWRLGALNSATSLTGSALVALALGAGRLTPDEAWDAAHVDEDWNARRWGHDELAAQRGHYRRQEFDAAAMILAALRP